MQKQQTIYLRFILFITTLLLLFSCNTMKYVGEDEHLLHKTSVVVDVKEIKSSTLTPFIRQQPNHKTFGLVGFPLFLYNLSGNDTTKWVNRWLKKVGDAPVIYDESLMYRSARDMRRSLSNRGYMNVQTTADTTLTHHGVEVVYRINANTPYYLNEITYNIPNTEVASIVLADTAAFLLKKGNLLDHNLLDEERQRITTLLRNQGYYAFNKEYINFTADTTRLENRVNIELNINNTLTTMASTDSLMNFEHHTYRVGEVYFITDYNPTHVEIDRRYMVSDTVVYKGYHILYNKDRYITQEALVNSCFIVPHGVYNQKALESTYNAFNRLRALKYVNIRFIPHSDSPQEDTLDCYIMLTQGNSQSLSAEIEGTNSAGDLGFATALTYQHRNLFGGSQTFSTKFRAAYESLSGDVTDIINDNYTELGGEMGINFPQFVFPFLNNDFTKRLRATTDFNLNLNFQQRPEYTRVIAGGGWGYNWIKNQGRHKHKFDLIDVSYTYLPKFSDRFMESLDSLAVDNPMLLYSYEDHFIMRTAYTFYMSNINNQANKWNHNIYTFRVAGEVAGNVLNALSKVTNQPIGDQGEYSFLGIRYAQYAKLNLDYTYNFSLNTRSTIAMRAGAGVAVPYGNSEILPFEKRYFSGGANSVRGWSVRSLGPGSYNGSNSIADFMNQCGDIRLDLNAEYRSKLLWKLEMALFLDAGNTWTIQNYASQEGGMFQLDTFYKQIAIGYGLGLRADFDFFILRLDWGIKGYDPARVVGERWVRFYDDLLENTTLHFAVGYPF